MSASKEHCMTIQTVITTMSSREFNQDTARAKRAAQKGPVFITTRGKPAYVLMSIDEYLQVKGTSMSLAEALAQPGDGPDFEFHPPRLGDEGFKPADLGVD
jgi:prevent-host-death family protein